MSTACCPHPGLPVVVSHSTPRWLRWRDAGLQALRRWRQQSEAQALRHSMAALSDQTLRDVGMAELVARRPETLPLLDWERGRW